MIAARIMVGLACPVFGCLMVPLNGASRATTASYSRRSVFVPASGFPTFLRGATTRGAAHAPPANAAALAFGLVVLCLAPAGARLLSAVRRGVHGRPRAALSLAFGHTAVLVALFNVLRLPFLLVRVGALVSSRH